MSGKPFDSYSKEYLKEFLTSTGTVSSGLEVRDETRQVDVFYLPDPGKESDREQLGLLGRMSAQPTLFEPYSKRPGVNEVRSCILKLMVVLLDAVRTANRERQPTPAEAKLPMLWILSPFASPKLMESFGGKPKASWPEGVYFWVDGLRTGFVAIDRLPETPETLWVRLLGRGRTLEVAISEVLVLPPRDPRRDKAVQLLASWKTNIEGIEELEAEDRQLLMTLSPAFVEWEQRTRQESMEQAWREAIADALETRLQTVIPKSLVGSLERVRGLDELKAVFKQAISVESLGDFQQILSGKAE